MRVGKAPRKHKVVVIKVGTSSLLRKGHLHLSLLGALAETCADLARAGCKVIVVTSGAVGAGCQVLGAVRVARAIEPRRAVVPAGRPRRRRLGTTDGRIPRIESPPSRDLPALTFSPPRIHPPPKTSLAFAQEKPTDLAGKQAMAAVGMVRLMRMYDDFFTSVSQPIAQVLVSLDNLMDRTQYLNAQSTFQSLLSKGIIPIVNENDTVAVQDMKFGDNDTLSAHIASLADADYLFLLTDVDGLYTGNPNSDPNASLIPLVENIEDLDVDTSAGAGSNFGTGGMATKIHAARMATAAGCHTVVMNSNEMGNLADIVVKGAAFGTLFLAVSKPLGGRKRWILLQKPAAGHVVVNGKAEIALNNDKSLMGTHILAVEGAFEADEAVPLMVIDEETGEKREFGRAIVNYSSAECVKLIGQQSDDFFDIVGYSGAESVAHRNNICLWVPGGEEASFLDFPEINMETHPSITDLSELMSDKPRTPPPIMEAAPAAAAQEN